jgi:hypothetical protein
VISGASGSVKSGSFALASICLIISGVRLYFFFFYVNAHCCYCHNKPPFPFCLLYEKILRGQR